MEDLTETTGLSPEQTSYWERRLVDAEKAVLVAKRVLGLLTEESDG